MAFVKVEKNSQYKRVDDGTIIVSASGIGFTKDLVDKYLPNQFVEVYFDVEAKKIGFKTTPEKSEGFAIQKARLGVSRLSGGTYKRIAKGKYKPELVDGMLVISVPEIAAR